MTRIKWARERKEMYLIHTVRRGGGWDWEGRRGKEVRPAPCTLRPAPCALRPAPCALP